MERRRSPAESQALRSSRQSSNDIACDKDFEGVLAQ